MSIHGEIPPRCVTVAAFAHPDPHVIIHPIEADSLPNNYIVRFLRRRDPIANYQA